MSADPARWFLTANERGNPAAALYAARPDQPWSPGNQVEPLVDGAAYFARLCQELRAVGEGDQVYFADWRGDPAEHLAGPGSAVMVELARAESAGGRVFGLVWRSHLDRFRFSEEQNRDLAQGLQALGARVVLDMRVRSAGSHHQKFVVIRHPGAPGRDVAFVGGIDLGYSRHDDAGHRGDPQAQVMSHHYGPTPPWHDAMLEIRGPAVADVECCFRERWQDPTSPRHARPWLWALDRLRGLGGDPHPLPDPLPAPPAAGPHAVQLLRTYPEQHPHYPFAPHGERTVARGVSKALAQAERLVYVEDQFLWSAHVAEVFATAMRRSPGLHLVAVVPRYPDTDSWWQGPAKDVAHLDALATLAAAGGDRVHVFDLENDAGTPIYVHAKVCIVDDTWASVGSANLNLRSWTHDSELAAAVLSPGPHASLAGRLRRRLWAEHLGRDPQDHHDLLDPQHAIGLLVEQARRLDDWHAAGGTGPRPAGHLRIHHPPTVPPGTHRLVQPALRTLIDPDARPPHLHGTSRW